MRRYWLWPEYGGRKEENPDKRFLSHLYRDDSCTGTAKICKLEFLYARFLQAKLCPLCIPVAKFQLIQGNGFFIISNDGFTVFIQQIDLFDNIIAGQLDAPDAERCFFLLRHFADVKPQENAFPGSKGDMGRIGQRDDSDDPVIVRKLCCGKVLLETLNSSPFTCLNMA